MKRGLAERRRAAECRKASAGGKQPLTDESVVLSTGTTGPGGAERSLFHQEKGARIKPLREHLTKSV